MGGPAGLLGEKEMEICEAGSWVSLAHTSAYEGPRKHFSREGPSQDKGTRRAVFFLHSHPSLPSTHSTRTKCPAFSGHIIPFSSSSYTAVLIENTLFLTWISFHFPKRSPYPIPTSSLACHTLILCTAASSLKSGCDMPCSKLFNGSW